MLKRRRLPYRPVRFPRQHRQPAEPAGDKPLEVVGKVESVVQGILGLVAGFCVVLVYCVFLPWRFMADAGRWRELKAAVPPITFLTFTAFLSTKALRVGLTLVLIPFLSLERSCSSETPQPVDTASVIAEITQLPSIEEVLLFGSLSVLLVALVLKGVRHVLARRTRRSPEDFRDLSSVFMYVVGFQYLLVLTLVALFKFSEAFGSYFQYVVTSTMVVVVLWPAWLMAVHVYRAVAGGAGRLKLRVMAATMGFSLVLR